jgi:hypothetical protein
MNSFSKPIGEQRLTGIQDVGPKKKRKKKIERRKENKKFDKR